MKLPFLNKSPEGKNNYLGLFLKEDAGVGFAFEMKGEKIVIVESEKFVYSNGWENLIEDVDDVLARLENKTQFHFEKTIFFLYSHLVEGKTKEIKKVYLTKIKELVKSLGLKALGYIDCYEAVASFLEKKEELPLTAVLIELDKTNIGVFVYKGGRVAHSKILARSSDLIDDLMISFDELRGKFLLPSRVILYNSKDLDEESTKILSHRWSEELFIQLPRVEIIREEEVFKGLTQVFDEQIKNQDQEAVEEKPASQTVMGFVVGKDIVKEENQIQPKSPAIQRPGVVDYLKQVLSRFKMFLGKIQLPIGFSSRKIAVAIGLAIIVIALFLNEYFFHKSQLVLYIPSQAIEKDLKMEAFIGKGEKNSLEINIATLSANFTESKATTGKREIGEKAKGEVTIHNFDDREKTFTKGAILEANGLKFVLDDDVKVASSSLAGDGSAKLPGKAKAKITAAVIGEESNLAKGQRFQIEDLSSSLYFAINENALSGGSKKEIRTVAKADMEDLKESILKKAEEKKEELINKKVSGENKLIEQLTEIDLAETSFSKELGEEADNISLDAKVNTIAYFYKEDEMKDKIIKTIKSDVEEGYKLEKEKISYKISKVANQEERIILTVKAKTKAIKDISDNYIVAQIYGKNEEQLRTILKDKLGVDGYEIKIQQPLPLLKNWLPFFKKNISLKLSSL